jgi:ComF family protein
MADLVQESRVTAMFREPDMVLPVPLHISRLRSRGFNQSLVLARACFPQWQDRIRVRLLVRNRATTPQTDLSGRARRNNLKNAFQVADKAEVAGRNILLVDDVFTTGSTVNECARVLKAAGCKRVEILTICRAEKTT